MSRKVTSETFHSLKEIQLHYRPKAMQLEQDKRHATKVGLELADQSLLLVRQMVQPSPSRSRAQRTQRAATRHSEVSP
jgi:hypothetical protein